MQQRDTMSSTEAHHGTTPAVLGGDLPEKEQLAANEGHDADMLTNKGAEQPPSAAEDTTADVEKKGDRRSSTSSSSSHNAGSNEVDVEKGPMEATTEEAEEPRDPNIVDWEGPEDPENPYNWPAKKKWANIAILSLLTLLIPLASSMFAPGVPDVSAEEAWTDTQTLEDGLSSLKLC